MNDRELLELAAKALGMDLSAAHWGGSRDGFYWLTGSVPQYWNPLTDDAAAFRLQVELDIRVVQNLVGISADYRLYDADVELTLRKNLIEIGPDAIAADWVDAMRLRRESARRAIVRAAAEMGKDVR